MDIDDAVHKVGGYRRWNLAAFFSVSIPTMLLIATQGMNIVFIGYVPPHHCTVPEGPWENDSIPTNAKTGDLNSCMMYTNLSMSNDTQKCSDGWTYETRGETSIVTEWNLVCDKGLLPDLTQVIYQLGAMVGDLGGSAITDYYGRKWVHVTSYFFVVIFGVALAFTQSYTAFIIIRFFVAIAVSAGVGAGVTYLMEIFDSQRRAFAGIILEFPWVASYMYVVLLGWLIPDWRMLQVVLSVTAIIGVVNILHPESPMWLEANECIVEAEEVLQKMARYNNVKLSGPLLYTTESSTELLEQNKNGGLVSLPEPQVVQRESILDLFRDPLLRKLTIIASMLWFVNNLVFYFMILNTSSLSGDRFFNMFLGGLAEIPAVFVAYYFAMKSRRILTCVSHICAGACLIVVPFIPQKTSSGTDLTALTITMALLGKFFISTSFNTIILYTKEFFPTNIRALSSGVVVFLGRLGNMSAPFASYLVKSTPWLINVILGVMSIVVALATLLLPETKDWPLPQSIEDVYTLTRGRKRARSRFGSM